MDARPGYKFSLKAPSAEEDGGKGDTVNKQNSNYFSPLTSKEEEKTLIVNMIQKLVKNNSDEVSETESDSETASLSDKKSNNTGIKRRREEDVTLGITPKGKRKRRHSKEVQEEKNELEESLKQFLSLTDKKTKITGKGTVEGTDDPDHSTK